MDSCSQEFHLPQGRRAIHGQTREAPQFQARHGLLGNDRVSAAPLEANFASLASSRGNSGEKPRPPESSPGETFCPGSGSRATIDNDNYSFGYLGEASLEGSPCYLLSLNPKRKEIDLIRGTAWIDEHSFLVRRVEGQMEKTPSWLVKKVDLKIDFAEMEGTWLQTGMEAVADIRLLGSQTLKSETVDVRIGSLLTQKTPPADRTRNGKPNRSRVPATMIVPLDDRQ